MNFCDCEFRNRAWDPNTHKCRTCGCWYVDTYRENREDVIRLYGKPVVQKKPPSVVLWVLEHRFHREALTVYGVYSSFERALDTAKRNLDAMTEAPDSWFVISEETLDKDPFDFTDPGPYERKRNICVDREGNVSARHQAGPNLHQPDFVLTPEERDFHINDPIPATWRAEWLKC